MKKVLGLIALAIMVVLPMNVNAAPKIKVTMDCPMKADGKSLDVTWKDSQKLTGEITCNVKAEIASGENTNSITLTVYPDDMNIVSVREVKGSGTWAGTQVLNSTKDGYEVAFASASQSYTGSVTVGTVTLDVKKGKVDDNCSFKYLAYGTTTGVGEEIICKVANGKYYGKNGTEVTKEVYESECTSNPQTGSAVPYVVIIAGIALAVTVFTVSRRNTKLYKI